MIARLWQAFTSSGVASVATSKSFGFTPSSMSRTAPPTTYALNPRRWSASHVLIACQATISGRIPCSEAGILRGVFLISAAPDPLSKRVLTL